MGVEAVESDRCSCACVICAFGSADPTTKVLRRSFCKNPSAALGFAVRSRAFLPRTYFALPVRVQTPEAQMLRFLFFLWSPFCVPLLRCCPGRDFFFPANHRPPPQDDYCFLISGLLDLYEASADTAWLQWALDLQQELDAHFWDERGGGYFNTREGDPAILLRMKARAAGEVCAWEVKRLPGRHQSEQRRRHQRLLLQLGLAVVSPSRFMGVTVALEVSVCVSVCLGCSSSLSLSQEDYDSAEPAASSVAVENLLRLSGLLGARRESCAA